jgi:molybdenum cofactor cytidylyltransferase
MSQRPRRLDPARWRNHPRRRLLLALGANKLLIELAGEPLVRRAARRALAAGLSPVIVVLGFEPEPVAAALADCRWRW